MATNPSRSLTMVFAALWLLTGCGDRAPQLQAGEPAPSFEARRLDGSALRFPLDYRGRVVALRFWADWCPYCKDEMRALEPVYLERRAAGLAVLAMNVGQSREVAERFVRGLGLSYEAALDPEAAVAQRYGVIGLPFTYFIDRQGRVRNKILGEASAEVFAELADSLLREPGP